MGKRLLSFIALMMLCTFTVSAETVPVNKSRTAVTTKIDVNEGEQWRGYFDGNYQDLQYFGMGDQFSFFPMKYDCAIRIQMGKGLTIEGIKFGLRDLENIDDVKIWMSRTPIGSSCYQADICVQEIGMDELSPVSDDDYGYSLNEIRFDEPYKIEGYEDVYIGYSFTVYDDVEECNVHPIIVTDKDIPTEDNAFFLNFGLDFANCKGAYYGNLAVQVLTSGDYEGMNVAKLDDSFNQKVFAKDDAAKAISAKIYNIGRKAINKFTYVVVNDGVETAPTEVVLDEELEALTGVLVYDFPYECTETGYHDVSIKITTVNGVENLGYNTTLGEVVIVSRKVAHVPFFEEKTSTIEGSSPFGIVARHRAKEALGDKAVLIAFHVDPEEQGNEPMECGIYGNHKYTFLWMPEAHINRTMFDLHPYFTTSEVQEFTLVSLLEKLIDTTVPEAEISVEGIVSEDNSEVSVKSTTTFLFNSDENNYTTAYMVVADSLVGSGVEWMQCNDLTWYPKDFYGFDEMLTEWVAADEYVETFYNDVPIDGVGIDHGVYGSIKVPLVEEEEQTHEVSFNLANNELVQNINNLSVCAFLINTKTGAVVNADRQPVKFATSINDIDASKEGKAEYYTIDGHKISSPQKGIVIVKYPGNKVEKKVIK